MFAVAVAQVGISIQFATAVVDVAAGIVSAVTVASGLYTAKVSGLAVLFEYDVDDTGRTLRAEFGRWVGDDLNLLYSFGRQLLQYLTAVISRQARCLTVDPHGDTAASAQRHFAFTIYLYRRDVCQHIAGRTSRSGYILVHVEHLLVNLELHLCPLACHLHFAQHLAVFTDSEGTQVHVACLAGDGEVPFHLLVSDESDA